MESNYLKKLMQEHPDIGARYQMKLSILNGLDPFTLDPANLNYSIDGVPPVTNMDIISYLVFSHSFYTKEQMKAYKSLQAYKYFESGFVLKIGSTLINGVFVVVGKVKHSQKISLKPLEVWCLIQKDGSILTAHCTCMAGISEVCSHVGAIIFTAEYANSKKYLLSCTDLKSLWPMPSPSSEKLPIVPVSQMNWGKCCSIKTSKKDIPEISDKEVEGILQQFNSLKCMTPLMYVIEPYASEVKEKTTKIVVSKFLIFNEENMTKSYAELINLSKDIDYCLTKEEVSAIEIATRQQNKNWYAQRAGRITASKFKLVCKKKKDKPSLSLIKTICYPTQVKFSTKQTTWGLSHEAVQAYEKYMEEEENHESFQTNEVGLLINEKWPQLAASPDRLVFCECCLGGCLEVKCPYLLKDSIDIDDYINLTSSCLYKNNGITYLKIDHKYYYQVQMQIFVSTLHYCDFVVWSPNVFFKQRILPDLEFWRENSEIALKYHSEVIMPELLGKFFTKQIGAAEVNHFCFCNGVDDGRPMILCDDVDCKIKWFHFDCVNLKTVPFDLWYCSDCLNLLCILFFLQHFLPPYCRK